MTIVETGTQDGPLLLFLHGGGAGPWMWEGQMEAFHDFHCVFPALQGHGDRSADASFSIRANSIDLLDWITSNRKGRNVHLIGFSIGAQICLDMLSLEPAAFRTAMINSAAVMPMRWARPMIPPSIHMTFPLIKSRAFAKAQARQQYMDGGLFEAYYRDSMRMKKQTLIELLQENMSFSLPGNMNGCQADILVTVGEKEKGIMQKSAKMIAGSNPRSELLTVPDMGHGFPVADPHLFNRIASGWITSQKVHK